MSDSEAPTTQGAPREQGWSRLLLALAAFLIVPTIPVGGALLPVRDGIVLLVPALAICTLIGWWAGGRFGSAAIALVLAGVLLFSGSFARWGAYGILLRAWAIVLAGAFGVLSLVDNRRPFFGRALSATGMAIVAGLGISTALRTSPSRIERVVAEQLQQRNDAAVDNLRQLAAERPQLWSRMTAQYAGPASPIDGVSEALRRVSGAGATAFPALLALQSIAALALAWAMYHRFSRVRLGPPLAALRDFRFNDQLVWGLIVGLVIFLLPKLAPARAAGFVLLRTFGVNLLVFFLSLYALRGLGVLSWVLSTRTLAILFGAAIALAMVPMTAGIALPILLSVLLVAGLLGLADTWFDLRRLTRPAS